MHISSKVGEKGARRLHILLCIPRVDHDENGMAMYTLSRVVDQIVHTSYRVPFCSSSNHRRFRLLIERMGHYVVGSPKQWRITHECELYMRLNPNVGCLWELDIRG
jgi:hypothetical protein